MRYTIFIVVGVVVVVVVLIVIGASNLLKGGTMDQSQSNYGSDQDVAKAFLNSVAIGKMDEAYSLTNQNFQHEISVGDFGALMKSFPELASGTVATFNSGYNQFEVGVVAQISDLRVNFTISQKEIQMFTITTPDKSIQLPPTSISYETKYFINQQPVDWVAFDLVLANLNIDQSSESTQKIPVPDDQKMYYASTASFYSHSFNAVDRQNGKKYMYRDVSGTAIDYARYIDLVK